MSANKFSALGAVLFTQFVITIAQRMILAKKFCLVFILPRRYCVNKGHGRPPGSFVAAVNRHGQNHKHFDVVVFVGIEGMTVDCGAIFEAILTNCNRLKLANAYIN